MITTLDPADEQLLADARLFSGLDRETILWLVSDGQVKCHADGGTLFRQGDPADRFYLVLDGRVNLFVLAENGAHTIIQVMESGQIFAEAAMFMNARFPVNAEMAAGTRLLVIPGRSFLARLEQRKTLASFLFASMARWQRRLTREIADLKGRSPAQRVGLYLLARSRSSTDSVRLPLTMADLASLIGITPESLSRVMARLKPLGVTSNRNEVVIGDPDALRRFCQGEPPLT